MQRIRKSELFLAAIGCLVMAVSTGCQCTRITDHYGDLVDDISDHQGCLDNCYCACFDLTRIGYADWRACRCNRIWCGRCAEKDCHYCQSYPYGAVVPANPYLPEYEQPLEGRQPPVPAPEPMPEPPPVPQPELIDPLPLE